MPVSRKRKKKSQSGRQASPRQRMPRQQPTGQHSLDRMLDLAAEIAPPDGFLGELIAHRQELAEHRATLAGSAAAAIVDDLVAAAPGWSDDDLEDGFCVRYGAAMVQFGGGAVEDMVNPEDLATALLSTVDERLHEAAEGGSDPAPLTRVLTVVAGVLPYPLNMSARDLAAAHLDRRTAKQVAKGRAVTGPVLWARDAYGTRWALVAPFTSAHGPDRWYLWDVDTCGYEVVTVHSGFHPSAEAAIAAWRAAVGAEAAGEATLTPADDGETLHALLTGEVDGMRIGGENEDQYAEFLRARRLGRTAREAARRVRGRSPVRLEPDDARDGFAERLRQLGYHDRPTGDGADEDPPGADEIAAELAESWSPTDHPTLYPRCSPHKVAMAVLHLRDYYLDDYAAHLVAVLPEWIRFLAEHTGMAAELTKRCLAYASGELQFPGSLDTEGRSEPMARVVE
nr:hypothetical protein [Micromonospora sp. DSM 115978]